MTLKGDTICSLIQTFPALLIIAQKFQHCLKTPFVYKPPAPTPSTEYYEALDALFKTLFNQDCNEHSLLQYGNKFGSHYPYKPCQSYPPVTYGNNHPGYHMYAYSGQPTYVYKKANLYNISAKPSYAPNQVYNVQKYRVVVKKNRGNKRRSQKLQEVVKPVVEDVEDRSEEFFNTNSTNSSLNIMI